MTGTPKWMQMTLCAAAVYNVFWGAFVVFFPLVIFEWAGMPQPQYPEIWQCVGMIVGVYGIGYGIAATNPVRHWPIVLVGLLGKVLGPIGFLNSLQSGHLPLRFGWINVTNDIIWWIPFALILAHAYEAHLNSERTIAPEIVRLALRTPTNMGVTLDEVSRISPVLLVFLRHAGCTFCREALADIAEQRKEIESAGARIVLVHMGPEEHASRFFPNYGLDEVLRISDPKRTLYRAFGLGRGTFGRLFGPKVWLRGFYAGVLKGHGVGRLVGDGMQMPGVFLLYHGEVVRAYRHHSVADRPQYGRLVRQENVFELGMQS